MSIFEFRWFIQLCTAKIEQRRQFEAVSSLVHPAGGEVPARTGGPAILRLHPLPPTETTAASPIHVRLQVRVSPSDIVQETFLQAHRAFSQIRGETAPEFFGWLRQLLASQIVMNRTRH
jgi:hypothetical protein